MYERFDWVDRVASSWILINHWLPWLLLIFERTTCVTAYITSSVYRILSLYVFGSLTRISFSKAACVPYCGLRDIQSRTQHVPTFSATFLTDAAAIIVHAAATTTSSDIIISCLHWYSFPAYFQSRDYCDADTVDSQSTASRLEVDSVDFVDRMVDEIEVDFVANVYEALKSKNWREWF